MNLIQLNKEIIQLESEITKAQVDQKAYGKQLSLSESKILDISQAIEIITTVLMLTQSEVVSFIEDIVSTALRYVYGDEFSFKMEFELKRNQPELNMYPMKNGMVYDVKFSCGVGIVDVVSFALRCACWALTPDRTDSVLVLDEPFKNLNGEEENRKVIIMLRKISEMLGLQIIIVSSKNEDDYINYADKAFRVVMNSREISKVEVI
jgi:hypothetical protein